MKKNYNLPEIELVCLNVTDIISVSVSVTGIGDNDNDTLVSALNL